MEDAMRVVKFLIALMLALCSASAFAFEIAFSADAGASTETNAPLYPEADFIVSHDAGDLAFYWDLGFSGDQTYGSLFGGAYGSKALTALIREGGLTWTSGNLFASFGILPMKDEVDSPYSLVLSSRDHASLNALIRYEDDGFFFADRWIALNYDSNNILRDDIASPGTYTDVEWPDRGAVIKSYGFKAGDIRFGFQDIAVFTDYYYGSKQRGPLFDASYFLIPAPSFFIQYARMSIDAPWTTDTGLNDNSIMSFFAEWKRGKLGAQAQFLVDDFNLNRILSPSGSQNPDKLAWAFGCSMETGIGTFRFDQAGATKYVFAPSGYGGIDNLIYGYTYYPGTEFLLDGELTAIDPETDYVGYLNGENNIAFKLSWNMMPGGPLDLSGGLEFVMSGSKSPANPWHEYHTWSEGGDGPKWLDEDLLEKKVVLSGKAEYALGDFKLFASGSLGYIWNRLKLTAVPFEEPNSVDNGIPIYKPSSENGLVGSITLGGSWTWRAAGDKR
jgi:hypothetical protein